MGYFVFWKKRNKMDKTILLWATLSEWMVKQTSRKRLCIIPIRTQTPPEQPIMVRVIVLRNQLAYNPTAAEI